MHPKDYQDKHSHFSRAESNTYAIPIFYSAQIHPHGKSGKHQDGNKQPIAGEALMFVSTSSQERFLSITPDL